MWQAQERTGKLPEQPPPAVVPPASIAGDELSIEALTTARRAVRAQQRLAKQAGVPPAAVQQQPTQPSVQHEQPLAQHFSLLHPQHSTTVLSASAPQSAEALSGSMPATDAADGVRAGSAAAAAGSEVSMQQAAEDRQPDGQDFGSNDASVAGPEAPAGSAAAADGAASQPRTQLQRQLQQLRLQSSGIPPLDKQPQTVMQQQMGVLTRPAQHEVRTDSRPAGTRPPTVVPQASQADQPVPKAAGGRVGTSDGAEAAPAMADADDDAASAAPGAADKPSDSVDAEASRTAWQRIMHSMASAPTTVRGGMDASWQTLQSLPQSLPRALPKAVPQSLPRLPWQPPADSMAASPTEAPQPTAQQRLMDQISGLELRPTAQDVLPDLPGAHPADSTAASELQAEHQQMPSVPLSQRRASAAALLRAEASASQAARDEAAAAFAALGDSSRAPILADTEQHGLHERPAGQVEAWRDGQRMRTVRFGRERWAPLPILYLETPG